MSLDYSCAMLSMYNGAVAELGRIAIDVTFTLAAVIYLKIYLTTSNLNGVPKDSLVSQGTTK
jgi:hypothetical protein